MTESGNLILRYIATSKAYKRTRSNLAQVPRARRWSVFSKADHTKVKKISDHRVELGFEQRLSGLTALLSALPRERLHLGRQPRQIVWDSRNLFQTNQKPFPTFPYWFRSSYSALGFQGSFVFVETREQSRRVVRFDCRLGMTNWRKNLNSTPIL